MIHQHPSHAEVRLAFSAPGKAFLAGGYLVLDPTYSAYVVALSARMHALIQGTYDEPEYIPKSSHEKQSPTDPINVTVESPQFLNGVWKFQVATSGLNAYQAHRAPGSQKNPFIEAAITVVMSYLQPKQVTNIKITIYSDDAYHSQENSTKNSAKSTPGAPKARFHSHSRPIQDVPKTGLGSSAALTVVVIAALVGYHRVIASHGHTTLPLGTKTTLNPTSSEDLDIIHNLAQLAHCTAQGKIGSGFDIASAVYGSIVYRRFPQSSLVPIIDLNHNIASNKEGSAHYINAVDTMTDSPHNSVIWAPLRHEPCSMPPGISLLMGDVCQGSETPKLVSTVLQWRKDKPEEANGLWTNLNAANMAFVATLTELRQLFEKDANSYTVLLDKHSGVSQDDTTIPVSSSDDLILQLKKNIAQIRKYLKQMTILANVPIEPDSQTELIDRCTNELPGVIGGVVPGAGGFDAIALVVVSKSVDHIKAITQGLAANENKALPITWLELREQSRGLVEEKFDNADYQNIA